MKTNCRDFAEEIAAFASGIADLTTEAAAHVQDCAVCRRKIAELKAVTALHREAAASLAAPKRRLSRRELESAMVKDGGNSGVFRAHWKSALAGAVVLAVIIGAAVTHRPLHEPADATQQTNHEQTKTEVEEEVFEPTLQALRREVESGRERMVAASPVGPGLRHYRVKDARSELGNVGQH